MQLMSEDSAKLEWQVASITGLRDSRGKTVMPLRHRLIDRTAIQVAAHIEYAVQRGMMFMYDPFEILENCFANEGRSFLCLVLVMFCNCLI